MNNSHNMNLEKAKRDAALDGLERTRRFLIIEAKRIAHEIAKENGTVTSPRVVRKMLELGYEDELNSVDRRFMGAVFRDSETWQRIGFENKGSHAGLNSIWKLRVE